MEVFAVGATFAMCGQHLAAATGVRGNNLPTKGAGKVVSKLDGVADVEGEDIIFWTRLLQVGR